MNLGFIWNLRVYLNIFLAAIASKRTFSSCLETEIEKAIQEKTETEIEDEITETKGNTPPAEEEEAQVEIDYE